MYILFKISVLLNTIVLTKLAISKPIFIWNVLNNDVQDI